MPLSVYQCVATETYCWWNSRQNPFTALAVNLGSSQASLDIRDRLHAIQWFSRNRKSYNSKKYFHPGGMARSDWTRSVRAVRDTPVADYSTPSLNTTRHVAFPPPRAVSPFLFALSVSYCKWTLCRWTPIVTICRYGFIGHTLASGLRCNEWRCENHSTCSFYPRAKYNSLFTNYTHHSKLPDICGYWQSIACFVHLLSYY